MGLKSELLVRNMAEDLKSSGVVLEQWIFFLVSAGEHSLCTVEKNIQPLSFDHDPSTVFYRSVVLVFFVHQKGDHSDNYGQAANGEQDTICDS